MEKYTKMNTPGGVNLDGEQKKIYRYAPVQKISTVFRDQEFFEGGACYVETSVPIKVKRIN